MQGSGGHSWLINSGHGIKCLMLVVHVKKRKKSPTKLLKNLSFLFFADKNFKINNLKRANLSYFFCTRLSSTSVFKRDHTFPHTFLYNSVGYKENTIEMMGKKDASTLSS